MSESKYVLVRIKRGLINGLKAKYYVLAAEKPVEEQFTNENLRLERIDPQINFVWWDKPAPEIPADFFGVEWEGFLRVIQGGLYRFYLLTDDGAKLWLNDELIIDAWKDQAPTVYHSDLLGLGAGYHKIFVRFYNKFAFGEIILGWIRPDGVAEIIPQENYAIPSNTKIVVEGVPEGYRVEFWSGGKILEAVANKKNKAILDATKLVKPQDGYFKILTPDGKHVFESPVIRDVWGGDVFQLGEG